MSSPILLLVVCAALLGGVLGEILTYTDHPLYSVMPEYLKIPKYASKDVPNWSPGNGKSFVDLSGLTVSATCDPTGAGACTDGAVFQAVMFMESAEQGWMDYWPEHEFCCTQSNAYDGLCQFSNVGRLILPSDLPGAFTQTLTLKNDGEAMSFDDGSAFVHHDIGSSGVYIIVMANCRDTDSTVLINGHIESMDPYGYLPADLFGNLPFFMCLMVCYTALGLYWCIMIYKHAEQMIALQYWITVLIFMGMVECTAMYEHYERWNVAGTASLGMLSTGLVFGITKRTVSRITITLLSLGYGIVKPSIGSDMQKVMQLGTAYFISSFAYVAVTMFPSKHQTAGSAGDDTLDFVSVIVFVLAAIDTCFYVWIIQSINALLSTLAARQQGMKYILYRNFRGILFLSLFFALVWGMYSGLVIFNEDGANGSDRKWASRWTVDALWELLYFIIMAAIAQMWAPNSNSQRYAYSVELTQLDDDDDYVHAGQSGAESDGEELDAEYGGTLNDSDDPFAGTGALDTSTAIAKKA